MAHHDEILAAARRICAERGEATFTADDIVRALPDVNPGTVRTHVTSRCCVNAPKNHPHKWDYFTRVGRGRYELMPKYRGRQTLAVPVARERQPAYGTVPLIERRATLHGVIARSGRWYFAQCVELPIVTQGRTLDETVANLRAAVELHLEGEDLDALGLAPAVALHVTVETAPFRVATA
jgi:predicted RNase H-like HicB family nuclease